MVQPGGDLNRSDVYPWKDASGIPIAWSGTDVTGGWIYWNNIARFVYDKTINLVTVYAPPKTGHDLINELYIENTLPFILSLRGFEVIHASAILAPGGVIAFSAFSGTGKSTTAYALQSRGYSVWADDAVIFRPDQGKFICEPIPFNLRLYPEMVTAVKNHPAAQIKTTNRSPHQHPEPKPLAAICLLERQRPEQLHESASITKLPIQAAFTQVLPQAYNFEQNNLIRSRKMMLTYLDLVSTIPIYKLSYPNGIKALQQLFDDLEATIISKYYSI